MSDQGAPHPSIIARLDRFESKMDKMADALTALARIEERQQAVNDRMNRFEYRLDAYEEALHACRDEIKTNSHSLRLGERLSWAVFAAVLSGVVSWLSRNVTL